MDGLAEAAAKAVNNGEIKFVPERYTKVFLNWMNNIQDWCISRQLWWGGIESQSGIVRLVARLS